MSHASEEALMRYLDGEATQEEARQVERWLDESPEARALVRDLDAVGAAVRAIATEKSAAFDISAAVMGAIEQDGVAGARNPRSLDAQRARRRSLLLPALGLSLAAAAAALLLLKKPAPEAPAAPVAVSPPAQQSSPAAPSTEVAVMDDDGTGAAIESVDFGAQSGTIFMVASGPERTPVVWLDDGDASEG